MANYRSVTVSDELVQTLLDALDDALAELSGLTLPENVARRERYEHVREVVRLWKAEEA